jgi:hypothetical protein
MVVRAKAMCQQANLESLLLNPAGYMARYVKSSCYANLTVILGSFDMYIIPEDLEPAASKAHWPVQSKLASGLSPPQMSGHRLTLNQTSLCRRHHVSKYNMTRRTPVTAMG